MNFQFNTNIDFPKIKYKDKEYFSIIGRLRFTLLYDIEIVLNEDDFRC